ncbi:MAG: alpha/beta fold hydrolase, partial [Acidimicrobiales bacterium]
DRATGFARVRRHLHETSVVAYDRRGYHRSRTSSRLCDEVGDHVEDLFEIMAGRRGVVVGHSFGAVVALAAAQAQPEQIPAVVAYEPPMPWAPWWPARTPGGAAIEAGAIDPYQGAEDFMRRSIGDRRWERLPEETRRSRRAEGPALVAEMRSIRRGPPPFDPTKVQSFVIVGRGSSSNDRHRHGAAQLALALPRGELHEIPEAGHAAHLSHPVEFAALIARAQAQDAMLS